MVLEVFGLELIALGQFILFEGTNGFIASDSLHFISFKIAEWFQQAVHPHLKDRFDSDKMAVVFLVWKDRNAMKPMKGNPAFSKDSKHHPNCHSRTVEPVLVAVVLTQEFIERCPAAHVDIVQQLARMDVFVDLRSGQCESMASAPGAEDIFDKCMEFEDVVVAFAVAVVHCRSRDHRVSGLESSFAIRAMIFPNALSCMMHARLTSALSLILAKVLRF